MNTLIIVGQHSSSIATVERLLHQSGHSPPWPTKRDGWYPWEITRAIREAHRPTESRSAPASEALAQLRPADIWHGPARDLVICNQRHDATAWTDRDAVDLLDFWASVFPSAGIILVYDEHHRCASEDAMLDPRCVEPQWLEHHASRWHSYHRTMQEFHARQQARCLLINGQEACRSPEKLTALIHAKFPTTPPLALDGTMYREPSSVFLPPPAHLRGLFNEFLCLYADDPAAAHATLRAEDLERFVLDHHHAEGAVCPALFAEMQTQSDLALSPTKTEATQAWSALVKQRSLAQTLLTRLMEERWLLLDQLHQTQAEMETFHQSRVDTEVFSGLPSAVAAKPEPPATNRPVGAAERIKQQLSYRLGHLMVTRSRSATGCLLLPFSLIAETLRFRRERLVSPAVVPPPPIHMYADRAEATKVKQQLSYRLGKCLTHHCRTPVGWLKLPLSIRQEIRSFHQSRSLAAGKPTKSKPPRSLTPP